MTGAPVTDTDPVITQKIRHLMGKKSGEERLMIGFSMFETAKKLVMASLLSQSSQISRANLKKGLFLRFYKNDFSPEMRRKVLQSWL